MSFSALNWAWDQVCPNGICKSVLVYLADRAKEGNGECWPSLATIVSKVQHSEVACRRAIKLLVARGLLLIVPRYRSDGGQASNIYRLPVSQIAEDAEERKAPPSPPKTHPSPPSQTSLPLESPVIIPTESKEDTIPSEWAPPDADAALVTIDVRQALFSEGLSIVRSLTGKPERAARALIGRFCRETHDDCARVLAALRNAVDHRPADPVPFIMGSLVSRSRSKFQQIHDSLGTRSLWADDEIEDVMLEA